MRRFILRHQFLFAVLAAAAVAVLLMLVMGCAPVRVWSDDSVFNCKPKAEYAVGTVNQMTGGRIPTRIAVSKSSRRADHWQGQAKIDGAWVWLELDGMAVFTGERHSGAGEVYKYFYLPWNHYKRTKETYIEKNVKPRRLARSGF